MRSPNYRVLRKSWCGVCVILYVLGLVSQKLISDSAYQNEFNIYLELNIHRQRQPSWETPFLNFWTRFHVFCWLSSKLCSWMFIYPVYLRTGFSHSLCEVAPTIDNSYIICTMWCLWIFFKSYIICFFIFWSPFQPSFDLRFDSCAVNSGFCFMFCFFCGWFFNNYSLMA